MKQDENHIENEQDEREPEDEPIVADPKAFITRTATIQVASYIGDPFWTEMSELIDIQKKSGMNRARSEDKKEAALKAWLKKENITDAEYKALEALASRPWYRVDDRDQTSEIVIPRHHVAGMLVQACKSAPAGSKFKQDELRSRLQVSHFTTGKFQKDSDFVRYVKSDLTNQRRLHEDEVLENFMAVGTIRFNSSITKEAAVKSLLEHGIVFVGLGAARKMGYGRGELVSFV